MNGPLPGSMPPADGDPLPIEPAPTTVDVPLAEVLPLPRHSARREWALDLAASTWRALHQHGPGRWLFLGGAVGALCGLAGFVFELGTDAIARWALGWLVGYAPASLHGAPWNILEHVRVWAIAPVTAIGGVLTGLVIARFSAEAAGGGTGRAVTAYHHGRGEITMRTTLTKMVASALTLGTGGSGGREGPIALVGAGFGSWFARRARLTVRERRVLVMAGVAGGVSAVFRAPLASALFAAEVLYSGPDAEAEVLIPSFVSSIVSFTFSGMLDALWHSLRGQPTEVTSGLFTQTPEVTFAIHDWPLLLGYAMVAMAAALGARALIGAMRVAARSSAAKTWPLWVKTGFGGLITGAIAVAVFGFADRVAHVANPVPSLSILGSGYRILQYAFVDGTSHAAMGWLLLAVAVGKIVATASTVGTGGSGGLFAPSLVIGGCVGGAIGILLHGAAIGPPPLSCMLIGMAAFLAASHRTPVAAILMVSEITGTYALLIPAMWACGIAFNLMGRRTIVGSQVGSIAESPAHRGHHLRELLAGTTAREAFDAGRACVSLRLDSSLDACRTAARESSQTIFPVLDDLGRFQGIMTREDLHGVMLDRAADGLVLAADLVSGAGAAARADEDIPTVLRRLGQHHLDELPLIDERRRLLGLLTRSELTDAYRRALDRLTVEAYDADRSASRA